MSDAIKAATIAQSILSLLKQFGGQLASHVDVQALELVVATAVLSGGGLPGILQAVITNAGTIFATPVAATRGAAIVASAAVLLAHHEAVRTV